MHVVREGGGGDIRNGDKESVFDNRGIGDRDIEHRQEDVGEMNIFFIDK